MEIIAYQIFSRDDCYILKTNHKIQVNKFGTKYSVYLTNVMVSNYQGTTTCYDGISGTIYTNLKYMYQIKKKYRMI
jgi:hypothetical protein|nr:MAG TPA: hypothetical protein [Caudoviricetes sp.]